MVVELVLLANLLARAGDHQGGRLDGPFLGFNSLGELIGLLAGFALGLEPQLLDSAKRVAREDERHAEQFRELSTKVAGVRVVTVDDVGRALLHSDVARELIEEAVEMRPKRLFAKIATGAKWNADDLRALADRLERSRIALVDPSVLDQSGDDIDALDVRVLGECPRLVDYVRDLSPGIGVPSKLDVGRAHQAVDGEREDVQAFGPGGADRACAGVFRPLGEVPLIQSEVGCRCAANSAQVRRKGSRTVEGRLMVPPVEQSKTDDGAEGIARAHRVDHAGDLAVPLLRRPVCHLRPKAPLVSPGSRSPLASCMVARKPERRVPALFERPSWARGELGKLAVVQLDPVCRRQAPIDLFLRPPRLAKVEIDKGWGVGLVPQRPQRVPALASAKGERPVVDEPRRLFRCGVNGMIGVDEVPRLSRGDFKAVLTIDDGGGDSARRMRGVRLHAVGHQVPTGHPLEDLAALAVFANGADHQRIRPEPPQMPRDVERRPAQNAATVGKVVEEDLAENDRSVVETVHGLLPDAFLGAGGFGPR